MSPKKSNWTLGSDRPPDNTYPDYKKEETRIVYGCLQMRDFFEVRAEVERLHGRILEDVIDAPDAVIKDMYAFRVFRVKK